MTTRARPAIEGRFRSRVSEGGKLLVPYMVAGLPSPQRFVDLAAEIGSVSDAIEVGFPYSDPVMDGPVIQQADMEALQNGMTTLGCLSLIAETVRQAETPVIAMTYFNPIHRMGIASFVVALEQAGAAGLIVPDLPIEEADELLGALGKRGIASIQMIGPTTSASRASRIAQAATGYVYAVSRLGVTGEREDLDEVATPLVERIRGHTDLPVLLGIGISSGEQAREAAAVADGVIVGSALVKKVVDGDLGGSISLMKEFRTAISG